MFGYSVNFIGKPVDSTFELSSGGVERPVFEEFGFDFGQRSAVVQLESLEAAVQVGLREHEMKGAVADFFVGVDNESGT